MTAIDKANLVRSRQQRLCRQATELSLKDKRIAELKAKVAELEATLRNIVDKSWEQDALVSDMANIASETLNRRNR